MEIRSAKKTDAGDISSLIYSAGPELYDFIYKTAKYTSREYIEYEFRSGRGFCGYNNVTVAVKDGVVVGTGCFYDGKQYGRLFIGTAQNMFKFYGCMAIWPILIRARHIDSVMKKPKKDELYLSNFGVAPAFRGQGIGTQLIRHWLAKAKSKGYRLFALDVADTNTKAEKLYTNLGLQVVELKKFSGKREGISVPNSKTMAIRLSP